MGDKRIQILGPLGVFLFALPLSAAPLTYSFSGSVASAPVSPYGLSVATGAAVSGQFSYDPSVPATRSFNSGSGYDQHIPNGFHATIGGVSISASDYVIKIFNDLLQTDRRTIKDEFIITFSSGLNPALPSNLTVNGIDRTAGLVSITFFADSSLFSDTSLPSSFNLSSYSLPGIGVFGDKPVGNVVTFTVVPEPSAQSLLLFGAALCCGTMGAIRFRQGSTDNDPHCRSTTCVHAD